MKRRRISAKKVRKLWDREGGELYWRKSVPYVKLKKGKTAGCVLIERNTKKRRKRIVIKYKGKVYTRASLIFAHYHGRWPKAGKNHELIRLNNNFMDDRPANLKEVKKRHRMRIRPVKLWGKIKERYIYKIKHNKPRQGFIYRFQINNNKKEKIIKQSVNLKALKKFRDEWLFNNRPDLLHKEVWLVKNRPDLCSKIKK